MALYNKFEKLSWKRSDFRRLVKGEIFLISRMVRGTLFQG
jgi:hypothetical protein